MRLKRRRGWKHVDVEVPHEIYEWLKADAAHFERNITDSVRFYLRQVYELEAVKAVKETAHHDSQNQNDIR